MVTEKADAIEEVVIGKVTFTRDSKAIPPNFRIFWIISENGKEGWCKGGLIKNRQIEVGHRLRLTGKWYTDPQYPTYGDQFHFSDYELLLGTGNSTMTSNTIGDTVGERVASYLKMIGAKKITYEFNSPMHDAISRHVLMQLNERVIKATSEEKDFYFLTALLDRNVPDREVQQFRRTNRDFKMKLLQCWKDAETELDTIVRNIRQTLSDWKHLGVVSKNSNAFQLLTNTVPGKHGIDQLLVCLKVIRDKYNMDASFHIGNLARGLVEEQFLKKYLISIHGVGHKIANWSLTNITGHWFVIDTPNIKPLIQKDLARFLPPGLKVEAENADTLFEHWFGTLDEERKDYSNFSRDRFRETFPDFSRESCEFLPFIVTQYLWFYGKHYLG